MSIVTTQTKVIDITQQTQSGFAKKINIEQFLRNLRNCGLKVGSKSIEELDQKFVVSVQMIFRQLVDERRQAKVFNHVRTTSEKDEGKTLADFVDSWLNLIRLLDNNEQEQFRFAILKLILLVLEECTISCHSFVSVYNHVNRQMSESQPSSIISIFDYVRIKLMEANDASKRWKDCVLVLVCHIRDATNVTVDGINVNGIEYIRDTLYEWLEKSASPQMFSHVVAIVKGAGLPELIDKYLMDRLFDIIEDKTQQLFLTWKAICILDSIDPKVLILRLLREIICAWPHSRGMPSPGLVKCISLMTTTLGAHPTVAKAYISLFKQDHAMILSSEFGFLVMIAMCGIERYKSVTLTEMRKIFVKLWKFRDELSEFGWLSGTEVGGAMKIVEEQTENLLSHLSDDSSWKLFGYPLISLAQSLLECPSSKDVVVVDGRVADGCSLWIFASQILIKALMVQPSGLSSHLLHIIQSVSAAANTSCALIIIEVLVEIMKKCAVDVLNNWRLIEGLFDYVCKMRSDVAVSLIRCLLPVINNRIQLRDALFKSLKKDLLGDSTVSSAIPILLLLLRSVSQRRAGVVHCQISQSFATFSSQSLTDMGLKRTVDESIGLEIVGILKRCFSQPSSTRAVLYQGIAEAALRTPSIVEPCLDLLLTHATTVPSTWKPESIVLSSKSITQLNEPIPQLVQAIECLLCEAISMAENGATQTNGGDLLISKATNILEEWVQKAGCQDVHDLGIDKLSEWNPSSDIGRSNFVFAYMMINLYDALMGYVWSRLNAFERIVDCDRLIILMKRRRELSDVLAEKTIKRKETKVTESLTFDIHQGDVTTSAFIISQILNRIIPKNATPVQGLDEVKADLLSWAIDRVHTLSHMILQNHHPLHSIISGTQSLVSVASSLLNFYVGIDCAEWICAIDTSNQCKTKALEAYANIVCYLSTKYKHQPMRVVQIWQHNDSHVTQSSTGQLSANGSLVRHCHQFLTKLYPALLVIDRKDGEEKKTAVELEKQAKAMIKIVSSLMALNYNPKGWNTAFKFVMKMLEASTFANSGSLRCLLKFVCNLALKCDDVDGTVEKTLKTVADEVVQVLSDEGDEQKYAFIENSSQYVTSDFIMATTEKSLTSIRLAVAFAADFFVRDQRLDSFFSLVLSKCEQCCDLVSRLLPLHTQFHIHKERFVQMLTSLFTSVEQPVDMLLTCTKTLTEMAEWASIAKLADLLNKKMQAIMAVADEYVGILNPEDQKRGNQKRRYAKSRRDETIYVKYVRARESFQSRVLLLCTALKDDRLNLQVKNNSIGMRDFRIDMRILKDNMTRNDEEPPGKKRRKKEIVDKPDEFENSTDNDNHGSLRGSDNHRTSLNSNYSRGREESENSIVY